MDYENDAYMSSVDDSKIVAKKSDTRRPRLTLKHLNKLRAVRDAKRKEKIAYLDRIKDIYGSTPE